MKIRPLVVRVSSYVRFRRGPIQYTGCPASSASARSRAVVAATGPRAVVVCSGVELLLDESSLPRTSSHTTKAAARASATTAPIRTLDRRPQPVPRSSLTVGKDKLLPGAHGREPRERARGVRAGATMRLPGRLAQLGEHQLDKLGVTGSSPVPPIFPRRGAKNMRAAQAARTMDQSAVVRPLRGE